MCPQAMRNQTTCKSVDRAMRWLLPYAPINALLDQDVRGWVSEFSQVLKSVGKMVAALTTCASWITRQTSGLQITRCVLVYAQQNTQSCRAPEARTGNQNPRFSNKSQIDSPPNKKATYESSQVALGWRRRELNPRPAMHPLGRLRV